VQDIVGAMVSSNTESGITVSYQDGDGTLDFSVASQTDENFTTADHAKLDGIEASADVTDATNVAAAGALMLNTGGDIVGNVDIDGEFSIDGTHKAKFGQGHSIGANSSQLNIIGFDNSAKINLITQGNAGGKAVNFQTGSHSSSFATVASIDDSGNFTLDGTVDGRDVATDGTKLDGIESGATADQTAAEIRTLVESASDSNVFTDADHSKLNAIEASADVTDTANVVAALTAGSNISIGTDGTITATDTNTQLSTEQVQDIVGGMVSSNTETGVTVTYQDGDGTLDFSVTPSSIGLGNVTNESKATMFSSAALTGNPTAPTQSAGNDSTRIATTAFVSTAVSNLVDAAPGALDTLNELAAAIGDDANFSTTVTNSIATKLPLAGGTMSGDIAMGDNDLTGVKSISATDDLEIFAGNGEYFIHGSQNNQVSLYNNGVKKFETGSLGVTVTGTVFTTGVSASGNITVSGTVDGRDVATDGTKLDGIESGATADQTASEIRALVESASDSNVFTDADHTKLNNIEASATADQTASEILTLLKTVDGAGSGLDADTLDGISSASFLRSDADDTTSGNLTIAKTDPTILLFDNSGANTDPNGSIQFSETGTDPHFQIDYNGANDRLEFKGRIGSTFGTDLVYIHRDTGTPLSVLGNISVTGTVDGRDVATDGAKLDTIESNATADQTASEIRTLVESASDSNVFTDADHSKLNAIEASADVTDTANVVAALSAGSNISIGTDGTIAATDTNTQLSNEQVQDIVGAMVSSNSESGITVTYQDSDGTLDFSVASQTDQNFTDADHTKLNGIETGATADQTASEIRTLVESASDSNVFTDADHSKLNGIEASADVTDTANVVAALSAGSNISIGTDGTIAATDTNTQLSDEQVQDIVGAMVSSNTESGITVTYRDGDGTIDFSVASQTDENFTTADHSKLDGIEASADVTDTTNVVAALTAGSNITIAGDGTISLSDEQVQDIVGAMVSSNTETGITVTYRDGDGTLDFAVASQTDNNFTNADHSKLDGIETGATADQTASEIRTLVESASDSNVFTDADHSKLNAIEASADVTDTTNVVAALTAGSNISIGTDGTIAATDTNTEYTAGTHLALSGTTFNLNLGVADTVLNIGHNSTNNEGEIILDTSNAGSPQISFTEHGDASWAIGVDDNDNSFKISGNATSTIPTINNLTTPDFEIDIHGVGYLAGNRIFADNYHPNADTLTTARTISLGGDLSGNASFNGSSDITITAQIAANAVGTSEIATDAIGSSEIAAGAVGQDELATNSVTGTKIAGNAVSASELNVVGNGDTSKFLRSDGDGSFTWATPTDTNTQLSDEQVQDIVGAMVSSNSESGITVTYQDSDGTLDFSVTPSSIGLGNVTNESKATMFSSAALTGNPTAPTQSAGNNSTRIATTAYADAAVAALVDSAPSALNTLNELAAALGDDANFSTTVTNSIATKLPLAGGSLTGGLSIDGDLTLQSGHNLEVNNSDILLTDNQGAALEVKEGSNLYLRFVTTNGSEEIQINQDTNIAGNLTLGGGNTVDGRDVSVDGSKLDGIESGATGDQTASEILTLIKTVDGGGSGLDADTLDGIAGSAFVRSDVDDTVAGDLTLTGVVNNTNNLNVDGPNFNVSTTNKTTAEYAYRVDRSGTVVGGIKVDGAGDFTNITVSGTVDGRDVASDGAKLDGIASGATANTGTVTGITAGTLVDVDGGGTATPTVNVDLSELTDMTSSVNTSQDELVLLDNGSQRRKRFSEIFGSNAYNSTTIPTNTNQLTNGSNFVASGSSVSFSELTVTDATTKIDADGTFGSDYGAIGIGTTNLTNGNHRIFAKKADHMYFAASSSRGFRFRPNGGTSSASAGVTITSAGRLGVGTTSPGSKMAVSGGVAVGASYVGGAAPSNGMMIQGVVGIGTSSGLGSYALQVNGSFVANSKSFRIEHPTKEDKHLVHGCLEGPEHAVYYRGRTTESTIPVPDYWAGLVDVSTMTVDLTPYGAKQDLVVKSIDEDGNVEVEGGEDYFYTIYGERKDIEKITLEPDIEPEPEPEPEQESGDDGPEPVDDDDIEVALSPE